MTATLCVFQISSPQLPFINLYSKSASRSGEKPGENTEQLESVSFRLLTISFKHGVR